MKISITYRSDEESEATRQLEKLRLDYPGSKVRKSTRNAPFFHAYLTVKIAEKPRNGADSA